MAALLKHQRGYVKGRITFFVNQLSDNTKSFSNYQLLAIQKHIPQLYNRFDTLQTKIEEADPGELDQNERLKFDDSVCELESMLLSKLGSISNNKNPLPNKVKCRLPEIDLPKFDGKYSSWITFRDEFQSLVHDNDSIDDIDRFRYLVSAVKEGSAYSIIEHIQRTNKNYNVAWQRLVETFDNENLIKKNYIRDIYNINHVKENSVASLQQFIDTFLKYYNALKALNVDVKTWDLFLVHHLSQKLDILSRSEVEKNSPVDSLLSIDQFIEILRKYCRYMTALSEIKMNIFQVRQPKSNRRNIMSQVLVASSSKCSDCMNNKHQVYKCEHFLSLTPDNRFDVVKHLKLCINCLSFSHNLHKCKSKFSCKHCGKRHHQLLHRFNKKLALDASCSNQKPEPSCNNAEIIKRKENNSNLTDSPQSDCLSILYESDGSTALASTQESTNDCRKSMKSKNYKQVVIATAIIWVYDRVGSRIPCRVVLDSASHANFITEEFAQKLKVQRRVSSAVFSGIGNVSAKSRQVVTLSIASRNTAFKTELDFLILPRITGDLPTWTFEFDKSLLPETLDLADPYFNERNKIDMLIGTEIYHEIVSGERFTLNNNLPPFQKTCFGYIFAGRVSSEASDTVECSLISTLDEIRECIERFWSVETVGVTSGMSREERECESHFSNHVTRDQNGRYVVRLPLKSNYSELGETNESARQQFLRLERRLSNNDNLRQCYTAFMKEYEDLDHMEIVEENYCGSLNSSLTNYFPHHGIFKSSDKSKIRVVFNGSYKVQNQLSLNDVLMTGPTIQEDLFSILTRFRTHRYAFSADIVKMYRQVRIQDSDQDLQRIWWRYECNQPLRIYRLKTVTYGTACAPFLAIRTLSQLAKDEEHNFPTASKILQRDFYVDDVATGAASIEEALALKTELIELLASGCFDLSKFSANFSLETDVNCDVHNKNILGIGWDTHKDFLIMSFGKLSEVATFTKRVVLSEITAIFDPLGLCSPVTFLAKHFMQQLWCEKDLNWDDELPILLKNQWIKFRTELKNHNTICVPRCILSAVGCRIVIHGFGDASLKGYGCCIYISITLTTGEKSSKLICSKSKIAPLRKQTIPRLELCAALLLAQLFSKVIKILHIHYDAAFLWTDSEVTYHRIKSSSTSFNTFVGNRIAQIQELTNTDSWYHVPTRLNPADIVSRGLMPSEMQNNMMWWNGPHFINEIQSFWPKQPTNIVNRIDVEHKKPNIVLQCVEPEDNVFEKYSNLTTLLRTVALSFRFIENCRLKRLSKEIYTSNLKPIDLENVLLRFVKMIQYDVYKEDISHLKRNKCVMKSSKLVKLSPFLDENEMLRVGGRIQLSDISYNQKHQYLLPAKHPFTKLLITHEHFQNLHAGPQALLNIIRRRFWIVNGKSACSQVVHHCIRCFRTRPITFQQVMGQIPSERIQPSRPFLIVGVDFCGPFYVKYQIRSKITSKIYIAVFVCFSTKACHMELVHDLTTEGFIAALRRFTSRRGNPSKIFSDNATNFIGAQSELKELLQMFNSQLKNHKLLKFCTSQGILWKTIPPRSPHFGGLWEAAIKSAKYHIKRVVGNQSITAEELNTVIVQIEAHMNSRPITPLSSDPNDLNALTPGHFLVGDMLTAPPDPDLCEENFDRLSRWQRVQQTSQRFWKSWSREYLNELQQRGKWHLTNSNITENAMVVLKDDHLPPLKWMLGRVIKTYDGPDNNIRVVDIKTTSGIFKRAVSRICVLPIEKNGKSIF